MDTRHFRIIAVLLGLIGAALLVLIVILLASRGDDEGPVATPPTTMAAAPAATAPVTAVTTPATSAPPPAPPTTPADSASPATTMPPPGTLTPATTTAPTTTEAPLPSTTTTTTEAPPAPLILQDNGIGGVAFGTDPATTIAYAESVLGPAKNDTGWVDSFSKYGTCPGPEVRGVEWGGAGARYGFALLFTEASTDHLPGGGQHLFGYYYFGDPADLETDAGITVGLTLGEAQAAHAGSTVEEHPLVPGSAIWKVDPNPSDDALLWGFSNGLAPASPMTSINGGVTCGE